MRIAVDVDGVLADFGLGYAYWCLGAHGYVPAVSREWDMVELAKAHLEDFWDNIGTREDFWARLPVMGGADYLWEKTIKGHEVIIVSNCKNWEGRRIWLERHGFMNGVVAVILQGPEQDKMEIFQTLGVDWVLDDCPATILACIEKGIKVVAFRRYDADEIRQADLIVEHWAELYEKVQKGEWPW